MNKKNFFSIMLISTSLIILGLLYFLLKNDDTSQKVSQDTVDRIKKQLNMAQAKKKNQEYSISDGVVINEASKGISLKTFSIKTIDGKVIPLNQAKGKLSILYFWTSTCPYCKLTIEKFKEVAEKIKQEKLNIKFITINLDLTIEKAKKYLKENKFTYPIFFDNNQLLSSSLRITGVPSIFLLDQKLKIIFKLNKWSSTDNLIKKLKTYL